MTSKSRQIATIEAEAVVTIENIEVAEVIEAIEAEVVETIETGENVEAEQVAQAAPDTGGRFRKKSELSRRLACAKSQALARVIAPPRGHRER